MHPNFTLFFSCGYKNMWAFTFGWLCWWQTRQSHPLRWQTREWYPCGQMRAWPCSRTCRGSGYYWSSLWCRLQSPLSAGVTPMPCSVGWQQRELKKKKTARRRQINSAYHSQSDETPFRESWYQISYWCYCFKPFSHDEICLTTTSGKKWPQKPDLECPWSLRVFIPNLTLDISKWSIRMKICA